MNMQSTDQTSRIPTDARTLSAGDFEFLRHFLTCLSFVMASAWLGGASFRALVVVVMVVVVMVVVSGNWEGIKCKALA